MRSRLALCIQHCTPACAESIDSPDGMKAFAVKGSCSPACARIMDDSGGHEKFTVEGAADKMHLSVLKARSIFWPTPAVLASVSANAAFAASRSPVQATHSPHGIHAPRRQLSAWNWCKLQHMPGHSSEAHVWTDVMSRLILGHRNLLAGMAACKCRRQSGDHSYVKSVQRKRLRACSKRGLEHSARLSCTGTRPWPGAPRALLYRPGSPPRPSQPRLVWQPPSRLPPAWIPAVRCPASSPARRTLSRRVAPHLHAGLVSMV